MIVVLMGVTGSGKPAVGMILATELGWRFYYSRRWVKTRIARK